MERDSLTIVIAAYNEVDSLPLLQPRIGQVLDLLAREYRVDGQVLYVDDGSTDSTWAVCSRWRRPIRASACCGCRASSARNWPSPQVSTG